jgi:hypothetical protein
MRKQVLWLVLGSVCWVAIVQMVHWVYQTLNLNSASHFPPATQTAASLKGRDLEGTVLNIVSDRGKSLRLKISDVELDPADPERETYLYTLLYQNPSDLKWQNLCQPDRNNMAKAIPLAGHWDRTGKHINSKEITFACTNGVLAKCVRWGYKPWKTVRGRSLRDFHQACTRMARADYCGNGNSHTKDGTLIDIYDVLGIQTQTINSGMMFEAAWRPDGAAFIHRTRWPESLAQIQRECPDRLKKGIQVIGDPITLTQVKQYAPEVLISNSSLVR